MPRQLLWAIALALMVAAGASAGDAERQIRRDQIRQCRVLLKESLHFIEAVQPDSAAARLREVLICDPKNPDAHYHLARIALADADTTEAATMLGLGVAAAPLSSRLKLLFARLKIAQADFVAAEALVSDVLMFKAGNGEALFLRGSIRIAGGDTLSGLQDWEHALAHDPAAGRR